LGKRGREASIQEKLESWELEGRREEQQEMIPRLKWGERGAQAYQGSELVQI
jgi:hypothetical protein